MVRTSLSPVLHFLHTHFRGYDCGTTRDEHLLDRFAFQGDEAAFEAIVKRHGPLVWGVCRRILKCEQDIEDAFQATFLVLVRKAQSIRRRASVTCWLHGVAHRIALQAFAQSKRCISDELPPSIRTEMDAVSEASYREVRKILDEEILTLPERLRTPLLLCCLEGRTKAEAAKQLGWKEGTVASRLARARKRLQGRLTRRGITLAAGPVSLLLAEEASAAVPVAIAASTVRLAVLFAAGEALAGNVPTTVAFLTKGILNTMALSKLKAGAALVVTACVLFTGAGWAAHQVLANKPAEEQRKDEPQSAAKKPETAKADEAKLAKKDFYGDPLPPGVLARMGSVQLRHSHATVVFSADSKTLISAGSDKRVRFWDVATGKQSRSIKIGHPSDAETFRQYSTLSPDGKILAAGDNQCIRLYDTTTRKELQKLSFEEADSVGITFSSDARVLALVIWNSPSSEIIRVHETATAKERFTLKENQTIRGFAFSPEGKIFGWSDSNENIHLCDANTGKKLAQVKSDRWCCLAFSPVGKTLATGGSDGGGVSLWDTATLEEKTVLKPIAGGRASRLAFSPDGALLAEIGPDGIILWELATRKELRLLPDRIGGLLAFSPDGSKLACWGQTREIRLWDVKTGHQIHQRPGHDDWIECIAASPDGRMVASVSFHDQILRLWDASTGRPIHSLPGPDGSLQSCSFSPDCRLVVCAGSEGTIQLWETATGKEVRRFAVERVGGRQVAFQETRPLRFASKGKQIVGVSHSFDQVGESQAFICETSSGKTLASRPYKIELHSRPTSNGGSQTNFDINACFTPDGIGLTRRSANSLTIEETTTGRELGRISGNAGQPIVFSPDGQFAAAPILKPQSDPFADFGTRLRASKYFSGHGQK